MSPSALHVRTLNAAALGNESAGPVVPCLNRPVYPACYASRPPVSDLLDHPELPQERQQLRRPLLVRLAGPLRADPEAVAGPGVDVQLRLDADFLEAQIRFRQPRRDVRAVLDPAAMNAGGESATG